MPVWEDASSLTGAPIGERRSTLCPSSDASLQNAARLHAGCFAVDSSVIGAWRQARIRKPERSGAAAPGRP